MSNKHQGIRDATDDQHYQTYISAISSIKHQAEEAMGIRFGPTGSNGHLSAKDCGKVGGAITKSIFLSLSNGTHASTPAYVNAQVSQQQHLQ